MNGQSVDLDKIHLLVGRIVVSNYLQTNELLALLEQKDAELKALKPEPEG